MSNLKTIMMALQKLIVLVITLSAIFSCTILKKEYTAMNRVKGLAPAISQYNELEKTLIKKVSERLSENGYPVEELTRVHLKNRISNKNEYYADNKIVFLINPAIYKSGGYINPVESITLTWEDPSVIHTPDGGIEFEVGREINVEDLVLTLFSLQDTYSFKASLDNQEDIFNKINEIFLACKSEDIRHLTSNGIPELLVNHQINIVQNEVDLNEFEVIIRRIGSGIFDEGHFNEIDTQYSLKVDLNTGSLILLEKFYPSFYPNS